MIPLPQNPTVVLRRDIFGEIVAIASNVSDDIRVILVDTDTDFKREAANQPFDTTRPVQPVQVLAARKNS